MKAFCLLAFAIGALWMLSVSANAQAPPTSGTVTLKATVAKAASLKSGGTASGDGIASSEQDPDGGLGVILTVADASPKNGENDLNASIPIRVRSNSNYTIAATRLTQDPQSATLLDSSDIKMSVNFGSERGSGHVYAGADSVAPGWEVGGTKTVGDLSNSAQTLATGAKISRQGNSDAGDNFLTVNLNFTIPRQYYAATSAQFTQRISVGIATP